MFPCKDCGKTFTRKDNLKRHQANACAGKLPKVEDNPNVQVEDNPNVSNAKKRPLPDVVTCDICNVQVKKKCMSGHLKSAFHKNHAFVVIDNGVEKLASAFGQKCEIYRVSEPGHHVDLYEFAYLIKEKVIALIDAKCEVFGSIKVNLECVGLYFLTNKENVEIKTFNTKNKVITVGSDVYEKYAEYIDEIFNKMSEFQERDSGKYNLINIFIFS